MEVIPSLSTDLIKTLSEEYPIVLPNPKSQRESELYAAGQRSVVDYLLTLQAESEKDIMITKGKP